MGDWISHMLHTPMNALAWWELALIFVLVPGTVLTLFGVSWWANRPGKGKK